MASSEARTPTLSVLLNGLTLPGVVDAEITTTSYLGAGRYLVRAALAATGAAVWTGNALQVEILLGLNDAVASLMLGAADRVEIDPIGGEVRIEGRDLSAGLMQARTRESFENRTSSEIAAILAGRHGLTPVVTQTGTIIGRYYQDSHTRATLDQYARATTEWDLLTWLAELEGFDVWVSGSSLFFASAPGFTPALTLTPADCVEMRLERALTVAGDIEVVIRSWNSRTQAVVSETASTASAGGVAQTYVMVQPNLTADVAQTLAQTTLARMTEHARTVSIEMPGDLTTMPRAGLAVAGTGTDFDGNYRICSVERHLSMHRGFTQTVMAKELPWTSSSIN